VEQILVVPAVLVVLVGVEQVAHLAQLEQPEPQILVVAEAVQGVHMRALVHREALVSLLDILLIHLSSPAPQLILECYPQ
jgi:hypothetical protein